MKRHVWKPLALVICLFLTLGALSGCGSHQPDDDDIFAILEEHDLPFYAGHGITTWYGGTSDTTRLGYAKELLSMFEALGEDTGDYDADGFADAISEEFDDFTEGSIFEWACWLLDADEAHYLEIYEDRDDLASIYGGAEAELEGTWYWNESEDVWIYFDGEWEINICDLYGDYEGIYSFDGTKLRFHLSDDNFEQEYTGILDSDGDIQIDAMEGWFVLDGISDDSASLSQAANYTNSSENFSYYDNGNGTVDYADYDCNVVLTCPTWMTVITEGIGTTTDATLLTDNHDGFVICDNVSSEWWDFQGSNEEYVLDYLQNFFVELTDPIFGAWDDGYLDTSLSYGSSADCLAVMEGNYWNDYYDISVVVQLESATTGYVIKLFLAPYGEDAQMQTLIDSVVNVSGIN